VRYSKTQKATSRSRIMGCASGELKEKGLSAVSLNDIMEKAGLTNGAFYGHFTSRESLIAEVVEDCMRCINARFDLLTVGSNPKDALESLVAFYLSWDHRDDAQGGCPIPALGADIARASSATRSKYSNEFVRMVELVARQYPHLSNDAACQRATSTIATMVGTVVLARATNCRDLAGRILSAGRQAVLDATDVQGEMVRTGNGARRNSAESQAGSPNERSVPIHDESLQKQPATVRRRSV
jgi:TetR/AcrR family transcriptional repressor of nem operon